MLNGEPDKFSEEQLKQFIEDNCATCESYAAEFFADDIYQAAEYLLNQIQKGEYLW